MKTIKNFLFKKRIKILKSKKGFSLLEVLIGVTIIGIIAAIAVPRFANYRDSAALTAAATTGKNLAKAYNLCAATKSKCEDLSDLNIACDTCGTIVHDKPAFCVDMVQEVAGNDFKACVSINKENGAITQSYGGEFKLCHKKCLTSGGCSGTAQNAIIPSADIKRCDDSDDCPASTAVWERVCQKNSGTNAGTCKASDGTCQTS